MRFMSTGEWRREGLMRLVLAFFLLFAVMLWASNLLMFLAHMTFDTAKIAEHYLGVETEFAPAVKRPYEVMLQVTHGHVLAIGLMLLTLTHMVIFVAGRAWWKVLLISLTFLSALANEASGWLIRYYGAGWAPFKIAMFSLFQLCLAVVVLLLATTVIRGYRGGHGATQDPGAKVASGHPHEALSSQGAKALPRDEALPDEGEEPSP